MELGSRSVTAHLLVGLDLLTALLVVVALTRPSGPLWLTGTAVLCFSAAWVVVRLRVRVIDHPMDARGRWWPGGFAATVLLAGYVAMLLTSEAGMWLAFPLMLLQLHLLGPRSGVVAVTATTIAAVVLGATIRGYTAIGYVLGPVVGAMVAVASVISLESLARSLVERQQALDELKQAQERLLEAESERSRAQERAIMARDLHDTIAQDLSAIDLHLRRVAALVEPDGPAAVAVAAAQQAATEGLDQARRFVAGEAAGSSRSSVLSAIRHAAERAEADSAGRTTIEVSSEGDEPTSLGPLPTELLRMTQSALSNVVRHAQAAHSWVALTWEPGRVLLDISDDGIGFVPDRVGESPSGGFGLPALRARVRDLGGTIGIESVPGEGTVIAISLPLPQEGVAR
ncbi:signal transduction histidine kinase [Propionicimonas paludicola]|uniref:Oxygen sensor histidine kinase NreB n=1 Tax=Propionicimonas paludicola TaxID=185243 RepID=A0A2A9CQV7_9ACTN|nr:ATP-binding protein [Propionicimonas paludicola]PFG16465.1 signal transduction histidine kinase [Propionicimonas paludicola]